MSRSKSLQAVVAVVIALAGAELAARLVVADWAILDVFVIDKAGKPPCYRLAPGTEAVYEGWVRPIEATTLRINDESIRGPARSVAHDDRPRLALVGDSHVFGLGVRFADTLGMELIDAIGPVASRSESSVESVDDAAETTPTSRADVVNFGVPGYDFTAMVIRTEEDVARFCPDAVAVFLCADDLQKPRCGRYAEARGSMLRKLALGRLWIESQRTRKRKAQSASGGTSGLADPLSAAEVKQLVQRIRTAIGPRPELVFVNLCRPELPEHAQALAAAVSQTNASVVDVTDAFTELSFALGKTAIPYDGHLNAAGNEAFAKLLATPLRKALTTGLHPRAAPPDTCMPRPRDSSAN